MQQFIKFFLLLPSMIISCDVSQGNWFHILVFSQNETPVPYKLFGTGVSFCLHQWFNSDLNSIDPQGIHFGQVLSQRQINGTPCNQW